MLALFVIIALPGKYVKYIVLYLTALPAGHAPARNTSVTFALFAQHELSAKNNSTLPSLTYIHVSLNQFILYIDCHYYM